MQGAIQVLCFFSKHVCSIIRNAKDTIEQKLEIKTEIKTYNDDTS